MQEAVRKMSELGRMPDECIDSPSEEVVDLWQTLTESVELPVTREEAEVLVTLLPEEELYGLGWSLMQTVESALSGAVTAGEYRELIQKCESEQWRETMTARLDNWLKSKTVD